MLFKQNSLPIDLGPRRHVLERSAGQENSMATEQAALGLVQRLCTALDNAGVRYCHWKSNNALDRSASGDNDLDLLVSRAHGPYFAEIMHRLGFKEAKDPAPDRLPGVLNYYGYDEESGRLLHVHTHYQLVLGHDMTKNYRLALEEPFLASATRTGLFPVPTPAFELLLFVIRMILKHSTWDVILGRQGKLSKKERQELAWLQAQVQPTQVHDLLAQHLPWLAPAFFDQALQCLQPNCPLWTRVHTGQQMQRKLAAQARRASFRDVSIKVGRRLYLKIGQRLRRRPLKKRLVHGGALMALVGGDGAGKSTAIKELHGWLAKDFDIIKLHLGKPPRAWSTLAVDGLLKVGRWLGPGAHRDKRVQLVLAPATPTMLKALLLLRFLCTARDRYRLYGRARRFATNGGLVICDRYPLAWLPAIDGPVLSQFTKGEASEGGGGAGAWSTRFVAWLARRERNYYAQMLPPDLLAVLRIEPELAVQRKPEEEPWMVRTRSQAIWDAPWSSTTAHLVDASRSKAEVLADLKSFLWARL